MASLASRLSDLATRVGEEVKAVKTLTQIHGGSQLISVAVNDYVQTASFGDFAATTWGGSAGSAQNICRFTQFTVRKTIKSSALRLDCTTGGTTGSLRMGLFKDNAGRPGLVHAQGTVAWATSMLEVTFTEVTLVPGVYWSAACAQHDGTGTNPQYRGAQRGQMNSGDTGPVAGATSYPILYATISGAFADNPACSLTRGTASAAPAIWMKVTAIP